MQRTSVAPFLLNSGRSHKSRVRNLTAVCTKDTFLKARYHHLAARRGKKRAIVAVTHSTLVSAWHMLTNRQPYQELGGDYFDQRQKEAKMSSLIRQLEKLSGGSVSIEIQPAAA